VVDEHQNRVLDCQFVRIVRHESLSLSKWSAV
jgi:hypothetical protein